MGGLGDRIAAIEARLASLPAPRDPGELSDEALATVAERVYRARRRRSRHFPEVFADPAWDMLLDLFVARVRGKEVRITSLAIAGAVPATTGLRWIKVLEDNGLAERRGSEDRRASSMSLTDRGYRVMRRYLLEGIQARELPTNGGFV